MFGKRLAELRAKMGISQYELAQRLHFSRGQIANYEQGTREPDFQTLVKIADFFDVSLDYLLGRTKYGEPYVPRRSLVLKNTFFVGEVMEELSAATEETVLLAVRTGLKAICVDRVESGRLIRFSIPNGKLLPLEKGASGKAILAHENKRIFEQLVSGWGEEETAALAGELERISAQGYSMTVGEVDADVCGIAAPIFDGYRRVIASLTVAGPKDRFSEESRERTIRLVVETAGRISDKMAKCVKH